MINSSIINAFITKTYNDIQNWAYANNVTSTAGGWTIGYTTYFFITGIMGVFTPLYNIFITKLVLFTNILGINKSGYIFYFLKTILEIIGKTATWLITIFVTFILLEYFFNNKLLKMKKNIKENDKKDFIFVFIYIKDNDNKDFIISKVKNELESTNTIINNKEKIEEINKKEKIIGEKIIKKEEELIKNVNKETDYDKLVDKIL